MPQGQPDYGFQPSATIQTATDVNSLIAASLGISSMDGRGRIQYIDTFKEGLRGWRLANVGAGALPVLDYSLQQLFTPPFSALLDPVGVPGASYISRGFYLNMVDVVSFEVGMWAGTDAGDVRIALTVGDGDDVSQSLIIYYKPDTQILSIGTDAGQVEIATLIVTPFGIGSPLRFKIAGDLATGKYVRLVLGGAQYDLSDYTLDAGGAYPYGHTFFQFSCTGRNPINFEPAYLDYAILSSSEPNN